MQNVHNRSFPVVVSLLITSFLALACTSSSQESTTTQQVNSSNRLGWNKSGSDSESLETAYHIGKADPPAVIMARPQVPILCYHQIRDWRPRDSKSAKDYIVPTSLFKQQIKMLADSGYKTISPDQLVAYLMNGKPLPPKPMMLTFDDGDLDQFEVAAPELEKYGFRGVFFIMTVAIGRRGFQPYMDSDQIRQLSERGHVIGAHTWDHQSVKKYGSDDWVKQIEKPNKRLEQITGKPVRYFAYPFGLWNTQAIPELRKRGYLAAFQLSTKRDSINPLFTIRRIIASGYWSSKTLHTNIIGAFRTRKTTSTLANR